MCHENEKTTEKKDAVLLNKKIALQSNAESLAESFHRNAQVTPEELLRSRYKYTKNSILKSLPPFPNARGHNSSRNVRSSQCIVRRIDTKPDLVGALSLNVT
jgi:hypothetical protein